MKDWSTRQLNTLGAAVIIGVAVVVALVLWLTSTEADRSDDIDTAQLVTAVEAEKRHTYPSIEAQGVVVPARKVTVEPEVSGRVSQRHPGFVAGGVVQENEPLFEIDPRDYELAVEQARTDVDLANADLEKEKGRQVVAEQEWERFGEPDEEPPPLALRQPQQQQAELEIHRAEQNLRQAKLDLERTRVHAPFTALVQEAELEPGQLVSPSSAAGTLVALDEFWVQISVPVEALAQLAVPGRDGDEGSAAIVRQEAGAQTVEHHGEIIRLLGDLDSAGRTAQLLVSVEDPFSLSGSELDEDPGTPALRQAPLLLNSFVSVELQGADQLHAFELPRQAVKNGDQLFVVTDDDRLEIRDIDIAFSDTDTVTIQRGLTEGERVVLSDLPAPVEGMPLRTEIEELPEPQSPPFPPGDPSEVLVFDNVARLVGVDILRLGELEIPRHPPDDLLAPAQQDDEPTQQDDEPAQQDDEPAQQDDEPAQQDDEPAQQDDEPAQQDDEPEQQDDEVTQQDDEPEQQDDDDGEAPR